MPIGDGRRLADEKKNVPVAFFVVLNGKQKGESFRLKEGQTSIGKDKSCDIVLVDETVSGKHASVRIVDKSGERIYVITDLDSSNGTFLNEDEDRIAKEELVDNDTVTFGETKMKFKAT